MNIITKLIRAVVPRSIRNALRRPGASWSRFIAKLKFAFGISLRLSLNQDLKIRCHPICQQEFSAFVHDREQAAEMDRFVKMVQPGFNFLDIGAHWGAFTLAALKKGGSACSVLCVEASAPVVRVLQDNLRLNNLVSQVTVINAACGAANGKLSMLTTGAGGADYFVVPSEDRPDVINVAQLTADFVCEQNQFSPHLVKIDVEGFEEEVVKGAKKLLRNSRPIVFLELHGDQIRARGRSPEEVLNAFSEVGYNHWRHVGDANPISLSDLAMRNFNARVFSYPDEICLNQKMMVS